MRSRAIRPRRTGIRRFTTSAAAFADLDPKRGGVAGRAPTRPSALAFRRLLAGRGASRSSASRASRIGAASAAVSRPSATSRRTCSTRISHRLPPPRRASSSARRSIAVATSSSPRSRPGAPTGARRPLRRRVRRVRPAASSPRGSRPGPRPGSPRAVLDLVDAGEGRGSADVPGSGGTGGMAASAASAHRRHGRDGSPCRGAFDRDRVDEESPDTDRKDSSMAPSPMTSVRRPHRPRVCAGARSSGRRTRSGLDRMPGRREHRYVAAQGLDRVAGLPGQRAVKPDVAARGLDRTTSRLPPSTRTSPGHGPDAQLVARRKLQDRVAGDGVDVDPSAASSPRRSPEAVR
jgi:hypothetical protein